MDSNSPVSQDALYPVLEAILMASDRPIEANELVHVLVQTGYISEENGDNEDNIELINQMLDKLSQSYDHEKRGFELHHSLQGWQLMSAQEFEQVVAKFITDGQTSRLSQAALESLAIIAYKQPITRAQVSAIRGVNSDGVIRSLTVRGLIREQGEDEQTRASLLVTTGLFLDKMNIQGIEELPSLAPFLPQSIPTDVSDDVA
nr:SMC-Scp complex subunit ScpB [Alloscardovia theropitheci]